ELRDRHGQTTLGPAVVLADDDVLGDVDETTGEVPRVGSTKGGVGQSLARTVRRDEELDHRQALTEVRADRSGDDLALRVGHQATHTGDLAQLEPVAAGAGGDHPEDRVLLREVVLHLRGDLVRRLGPDLDLLLTALVVGDQAALVLLLDLRRLLLVRGEDLRLALWGDDVGDGHGRAGAGGPVVAGLLERVERRGDLHLGVTL